MSGRSPQEFFFFSKLEYIIREIFTRSTELESGVGKPLMGEKRDLGPSCGLCILLLERGPLSLLSFSLLSSLSLPHSLYSTNYSERTVRDKKEGTKIEKRHKYLHKNSNGPIILMLSLHNMVNVCGFSAQNRTYLQLQPSSSTGLMSTLLYLFLQPYFSLSCIVMCFIVKGQGLSSSSSNTLESLILSLYSTK